MRGARTLVIASAGLLPVAAGCSPSAPRCYDPELLSSGEASLRRTQGYVDVSTAVSATGDAKACEGCQFFRREVDGGDCGHCEILGGSVSAKGHCNGWSAKRSG